ncbi:unnamed protein product [Lampetra fluviatilis]
MGERNVKTTAAFELKFSPRRTETTAELYVHGPDEDVEVLGASGSDESHERASTVPHPVRKHLLSARPCRYLRRPSGIGQHRSWFRRLIFSGCMASSKQE